jgi:hypothetical protein
MKNKAVPLRMPEGLLDLVAIQSQEQYTHKATVLRQWLYRGAEESALRLVEEGSLKHLPSGGTPRCLHPRPLPPRRGPRGEARGD